MDRTILKSYFRESLPPEWLCPTCNKSVLRIVPGTFHKAETRASREAHSHGAWDTDWVRYTYSCMLECSNPSCKEVVASTGHGCVDLDFTVDENGEPDYEYADFFQPLHFHPNLQLFKIPAGCPKAVRDELERSFNQFFSSPDAALNSARASVEQLVTELGVKRFQVKNGKRSPINLHIRIGLLTSRHSTIKDHLIAIKWLGNAGSHPGSSTTLDDVMDAYELIEHVLSELYDGKAKAMNALAKKVNKRKGPKK